MITVRHTFGDAVLEVTTLSTAFDGELDGIYTEDVIIPSNETWLIPDSAMFYASIMVHGRLVVGSGASMFFDDDGLGNAVLSSGIHLMGKGTIETHKGSTSHYGFIHGAHLETPDVPIHINGLMMFSPGIPEIIGEYPIHLHMCKDATRGAVIENVTIHNSPNGGIVPHGSHGVSILNCAIYDSHGSSLITDGTSVGAIGWDPRSPGAEKDSDPNNPDHSHDTVIDGCLVERWSGPGPAYQLADGLRNIMRNCIARDVTGLAGFNWSAMAQNGLWIFEDNLAEYCTKGFRSWQNDIKLHTLVGSVARHCTTAFDIGAYVGMYQIIDATIENCGTGFLMHMRSPDPEPFPGGVASIINPTFIHGPDSVWDIHFPHNTADNVGSNDRRLYITGGNTTKVLIQDGKSADPNHDVKSSYIFADAGVGRSTFTIGTRWVPSSNVQIWQNGVLVDTGTITAEGTFAWVASNATLG